MARSDVAGCFILLCLGLLIGNSVVIAAWPAWQQDGNEYGPLLGGLGLALLFWRWLESDPLAAGDSNLPAWVMLTAGACFFAVGRSQEVALIESFGLLGLIAAVMVLSRGRGSLRQFGFPLFFLLFSLPLPGWLIDLVTAPLKTGVSQAAESLLYAAGYPVARSGVVLALGPYRLLVADACSGLHSLIFLTALGLFYLHLTGPRRLLCQVALIALLLPIAVIANVLRVLALMLMTYHFGYAAGQGGWHELTGLFSFISAFMMLLAADRWMIRHWPLRQTPQPAAGHPAHPVPRPVALTALAGLLLALVAGEGLKPVKEEVQRASLTLAQLVPAQIGAWQLAPADSMRLVQAVDQSATNRLYNQLLERIYVNAAGERIMLSIAFGGHQLGNALQAHRPEFCYVAQGFELLGHANTELVLAGQVLPVRRVVARQGSRVEPLTYWMTVGRTAVLPGIQRKLAQIRQGLQGKIPDGALVRVSSLVHDTDAAFRTQADFVEALHGALAGHPEAGILFGQSGI